MPFGQQALSGLGSAASGPATPSAYQQYNQALPETFSIFNQGSQNLSAPALASLLGAVYQPQGGQPYAPGPDYYRELLEIQRKAAENQTGGGDPFAGMSDMIAGMLEASRPQAPQQQTVSSHQLLGDIFPTQALNEFMFNGVGNLGRQFQDQGMQIQPYSNPYVKVDPFKGYAPNVNDFLGGFGG